MSENSIENKQYKVVVYLRKSSEDTRGGKEKRQLNSLKYQETVTKAIIQREGLKLVREPFQDSHTGYRAYVREGFNEMLGYLRENKGGVDGIVCTEINRLARNFGDGGQILWFLQDDTIRKIFTHDKIFTDSSTDQLMVAIEFALAKHSSDETSFRARVAAESKIATESQPPKKSPIGYKTEGKVGHKAWIQNENAPIIRNMFEDYATGKYTLEQLADRVYLSGLRSTSEITKTGRISKNTIRNRLRDIDYTGVFTFMGEKYAGKYLPIISSELYYKVQQVLDSKKNPKTSHIEYAYSGIIRCKDCGRFLSGTHKKGNTYYRCDKRSEPCKHTKNAYINEKVIEKELIPAFESIDINEERWKLLREYALEVSEEDKADYSRKAIEYANQIYIEEEKQKERAQALVDRKLEKEMYDKLKVDSDERIKILRESQIKCENYVYELKSLMFGFLDNVKFITRRFKTASPPNKKEMVDIFCENLKWDGEKLHWDWKKPYLYLAKPSKNLTWLGS